MFVDSIISPVISRCFTDSLVIHHVCPHWGVSSLMDLPAKARWKQCRVYPVSSRFSECYIILYYIEYSICCWFRLRFSGNHWEPIEIFMKRSDKKGAGEPIGSGRRTASELCIICVYQKKPSPIRGLLRIPSIPLFGTIECIPKWLAQRGIDSQRPRTLQMVHILQDKT